ncbi:MAG: hypothetical protein HYZ53_12290 [Planctomycetes bacterium]|nr:hypothetical protein [Planctomycetota bacterium]
MPQEERHPFTLLGAAEEHILRLSHDTLASAPAQVSHWLRSKIARDEFDLCVDASAGMGEREDGSNARGWLKSQLASITACHPNAALLLTLPHGATDEESLLPGASIWRMVCFSESNVKRYVKAFFKKTRNAESLCGDVLRCVNRTEQFRTLGRVPGFLYDLCRIRATTDPFDETRAVEQALTRRAGLVAIAARMAVPRAAPPLPLSDTEKRTRVDRPPDPIRVSPQAVPLPEHFAFTVRVDPAEGGTVRQRPDSPQLGAGKEVSLEAVPNLGWEFACWSDGSLASTRTHVIARRADVMIAHFKGIRRPIRSRITVGSDPPGAGRIEVYPKGSEFEPGWRIKLEAIDVGDWTFDKWSDGERERTRAVVVPVHDIEYRAQFKTDIRSIVAEADPPRSGSVSILPSGGVYRVGEHISFEARPAAGWAFKGWSDGSSSTSVRKLVVGTSIQLRAYFAKEIYCLKHLCEPDTAGTIVTDPAQATFFHGSRVTLVAKPRVNSRFVEWSDGHKGVERVLHFDGKDISIQARFEWRRPLLRIEMDPTTGGTVSIEPADGPYVQGSRVALAASASVGFQFHEWSDGVRSPSREYTVPDVTFMLVARFTRVGALLEPVCEPARAGTVAVDAPASLVQPGARVHLEARPQEGWQFDRWSDGSNEPRRTYDVPDRHTRVIARFSRQDHPRWGGKNT